MIYTHVKKRKEAEMFLLVTSSTNTHTYYDMIQALYDYLLPSLSISSTFTQYLFL